MNKKARIEKVVSQLPSTLEKNTIYYVRVGNGFEIYCTNDSGIIVAYPTNYVNSSQLGNYIFGSNFTGTIQGYSPDLGLPANSFKPSKSGFYRPNGENEYGSLLMWVNHPSTGGEYGAGIAFDYGGVNAWLTGIDGNGNKTPNRKIWTSGDFNPSDFATSAQLGDYVNTLYDQDVGGLKTFTGIYSAWQLNGDAYYARGFIQSLPSRVAIGTTNDNDVVFYRNVQEKVRITDSFTEFYHNVKALNISAQNASDKLIYDNIENFGSPLRINANASLGIYLQADGNDIFYVGPGFIESKRNFYITNGSVIYTSDSNSTEWAYSYKYGLANRGTWNNALIAKTDHPNAVTEYAGYPSTTGFKSMYGTSLHIKGNNSWYNRLDFNTNGNIDWWHGINTTDMTYRGQLPIIPSGVTNWDSDNLPDYKNYGLGRTAQIEVDDLNTLPYTGFYGINPNTANAPFGYGVLINQRFNPDEYTQIAVEASSGRIKTRAVYGGGQYNTGWLEYWNSDNLPDYRKYGLGKFDLNAQYNINESRETGFYSIYPGLTSGDAPFNYGSLIHMSYAGTTEFAQIGVQAGADKLVYRRRSGDGSLGSWVTVWDNVNFNPAQYVTQSSLNSTLSGYATLAGVQTFQNTNTFLQSPVIPNGTLGSHAVNLNQLSEKVSGWNGVIALAFQLNDPTTSPYIYHANGSVVYLATHQYIFDNTLLLYEDQSIDSLKTFTKAVTINSTLAVSGDASFSNVECEIINTNNGVVHTSYNDPSFCFTTDGGIAPLVGGVPKVGVVQAGNTFQVDNSVAQNLEVIFLNYGKLDLPTPPPNDRLLGCKVVAKCLGQQVQVHLNANLVYTMNTNKKLEFICIGSNWVMTTENGNNTLL